MIEQYLKHGPPDFPNYLKRQRSKDRVLVGVKNKKWLNDMRVLLLVSFEVVCVQWGLVSVMGLEFSRQQE